MSRHLSITKQRIKASRKRRIGRLQLIKQTEDKMLESAKCDILVNALSQPVNRQKLGAVLGEFIRNRVEENKYQRVVAEKILEIQK